MKIFYATAMTDIPETYKKMHSKNVDDTIKKIQSNPNIIVYSGLTTPAQINREIFDQKENEKLYKWYINLIKKSDLFIADVTFPSIGVGIELQNASFLSKPIYLIINTSIKKKENISRMLLGIDNIVKVIEYQDTNSLINKLKSEVKNITT